MRYATKGVWTDLRKWQRQAAAAGRIDKVFVGSMMDVAEKDRPLSAWDGGPMKDLNTGEPVEWTLDSARQAFFEVIVPDCPNLFFQLLSKRPGNFRKVVPPQWLERGPVRPVSGSSPTLWPVNVMAGCSVVDQPTADTLIPQLLELPCAKFLSVEPLLGPVDLNLWRVAIPKHRESWPAERVKNFWVIVGGESGPGARPCNITWIRDVISQCREYGVPVFVKQLGSKPYVVVYNENSTTDCGDEHYFKLKDSKGGDWDEWSADLRVRECPEVEQVALEKALASF